MTAVMGQIEWMHLGCQTCGHWAVGQFAKNQVADWLRAHGQGAGIRVDNSHIERESTCPHPCGTPFHKEERFGSRETALEVKRTADYPQCQGTVSSGGPCGKRALYRVNDERACGLHLAQIVRFHLTFEQEVRVSHYGESEST